jgi:lipopolysaccharide/colanic/teichoic acid biosynthesis glycosyltransferase
MVAEKGADEPTGRPRQRGSQIQYPRTDWPIARPKPYAVPVCEIVSTSGRLAEAVYRGFEILAAGFALAAGLPILLIVAAVIFWDSPGPLLFFHRRQGARSPSSAASCGGGLTLARRRVVTSRNVCTSCRAIFVYQNSARSYADARARFPDYYAYEFGSGELHQQYPTNRHDPRLTPVGRILRKLSIDELPNLWCVLMGQIRLAGPRPEAPEVLQYYTPEEMYKFTIKPGITGRGLLDWGQTLAWDLQYVRTRSVWLDLKIIAITLKHVITRHGAF